MKTSFRQDILAVAAISVGMAMATSRANAQQQPAEPPTPMAAPYVEAAPQAPVSPYMYPPPQYIERPGYDTERPRPRRRPRPGRGLMIAGFSVFGATYLAQAIIGVVLGSQDPEFCDCGDAYRLLIPIVGPLTLLRRQFDGVNLNAPLVVDSLAQTAGLVLAIFGVVRASESRQDFQRDSHWHLTPRLSFAAGPTLGGAYASMRLQL